MINYMLIKLSCVGAIALASAIWILYLVLTQKREMGKKYVKQRMDFVNNIIQEKKK